LIVVFFFFFSLVIMTALESQKALHLLSLYLITLVIRGEMFQMHSKLLTKKPFISHFFILLAIVGK